MHTDSSSALGTAAAAPARDGASGTPRTPQVVLAGRVVAVAAVKEHPDRYSALIARARSEVGHAICPCRTDQVVRLVIRLRSGRYHLAGWPDGGHLHAPGCTWYRSHSSLSGRTSCGQALTVDESGTSIRLSTPLIVRGARATPPGAAPRAPARAAAAVEPKMGLLALLHHLWESAQLNLWRPGSGKRTWRTCRALLAEQTRDCRVEQQELADALWIVPAFHAGTADHLHAAWTRFLARLGGTGGTRRRGLILGEIKSTEPTEHGVRVRLAHQRAALYCTRPLMDRVARSYPAAFSRQVRQVHRPARRQVVLCVIERSARGHPVIVDLAAMLTTAAYLPADSSHEARMADALMLAGRTFVKPLHYAGGAVFPDFVLLDDTPHTHVEVWGVRGRAGYEQRKRVKQRHYRDSGQALLEWDVRDPLPNLRR